MILRVAGVGALAAAFGFGVATTAIVDRWPSAPEQHTFRSKVPCIPDTGFTLDMQYSGRGTTRIVILPPETPAEPAKPAVKAEKGKKK
jgi:hypothetical protein